MLIQLTIIVLLAAIVVFFARDFAAYIKKIMAVPSIAWILPITIASWAVVYFDYWTIWTIFNTKLKLHELYSLIGTWLAFSGGYYLSAFIILMLFSILPLVLINAYYKRSYYQDFEYRYFTSLLIWTYCIVLLLF